MQKMSFTPKVLAVSVLALFLGACQLKHETTTSTTPLPSVQATAPATPSIPTPTIIQQKNGQNIYDYRLDNGLRVIIKPQKSPIVLTQIWYDVGSNDEPVGKGGISHFLEHMMFKTSAGIDGAVYDRVVGHFGGSRNAFTSTNYTSYYQLLPANQYPLGIEIEANRMRGLVFDAAEVATEKQVVIEERKERTEDNPMAKAYELLATKLFDNANARPVIGAMADIEALTLDDLKAWYDRYYYANNATLIITGGVDVDEAMGYVMRYFATLPKGELAKKPDLSQKSHRGYQEFTTYQEVKVPSLVITYNVPTLQSAKDPSEAYALALFADVADGSNSARFVKNLVRGKEILSGISTDYDFISRGDGVLSIFATPSDGVSLDEAKAAILAELDGLMDQPILAEERKRGETALKAALILQNDSITAQAATLGVAAMYDLPLDINEKMLEALRSVSTPQIQKTAKHYLTKDNMTVMYVLPKGSEPNNP